MEKPLPDLIQMGLSESRDSEVYKQAYDKAIQLGGDGKFYLDWRWDMLDLFHNNGLSKLSICWYNQHTSNKIYDEFNL